MDNTNRTSDTGQNARKGIGYSTPGEDRILHSTDPDIASPTETSEQRLTTPKSHLQSINEDPGDANPALEQTIAEEQGQLSTAELLAAREEAEEHRLRNAHAPIYQDEGPDQISHRFSATDTGQPDSPYNYQGDAAARSIDSLDVQQDFGSIDTGVGAMDLRARAESLLDRDGSQTTYADALRGEGPYGEKARELDASGPETTDKFVPGDNITTEMKNIPDEE